MSVTKDTEKKMQGAEEHFKVELKNLRSSRPNPAILDSVKVEVYGTEMKIKELGQVSVTDSRQLLVTPFDPQTAGPIAKAIEKANLNLQAILENNLVRVPIPPLTEEIRKDTVKEGKKRAEAAKVQIRKIRQEANATVAKQKADGDITEDLEEKMKKEIQKLTDKFCKDIETLFAEKEKDIMEV